MRGRHLSSAWFVAAIGLVGCATTNRGPAPAPDGMPFPGARRQPIIEGESDLRPTVVGFDHYRDPLQPVNRAIFAVNDVAYRYLLIPISNGYTAITPDPVERSIGNFFDNLKMPVYAVNHLLQVKPRLTGRNLARFGINTTIGILGFFDPASASFNLPRQATNMDNTLAHYGIGYGIYLVIPIMGPADVRNVVARVGDYFLDPLTYLVENPEAMLIRSFDYLQEFAPRADQYSTLKREAEDPYIFFRNMHLQGIKRDAQYRSTD